MMRVFCPSQNSIPSKITTTVFAFPHQFQNLSLVSSFLMMSNTRQNIHNSCMNHKGQIPLIVHMKYFAIPGTPAVRSEPCTTDEIWVLKYPVIHWKTNNQTVAGTSNLRVRNLNHSLPEYFCNEYLALIPANVKSNGINRGYRMYIMTSWYCCTCGNMPNHPIPPKTHLLLKK